MDVRLPVAHTPLGNLAGVTMAPGGVDAHLSRLNRPVVVFRGIPYALAPTGPLRFAPPVPAAPWSGMRMADQFGPMAPQVPGLLESMLDGGSVAVDEDNCLTLNVWTPACDHGYRPVMVWIHGGAFLTGGGAVSWYDGTRFASEGNVVVVTINYRLGVFGFLHLQDAPDSGTVGLADQMEALRWVQNNIAAFGGDPHRVTVFGESAGAMSIGAMLGGRMGACHAVEIPFVFDNVHQTGASQFLGAAQHLEELSAQMNQAWIRFAYGDAPHPQWPAEDESHQVWRFHNDDTAGLVSDPYGSERSCWHHS